MLVEIKGISLKADFSVETFVDIVEYKKRYEPHDKVTLTQYLQMVTDDERSVDTVCELLYYPHAIKMRKLGMMPKIEYKDVAVHLIKNAGLVNEIIQDLVQSLPEPEQEAKKKPSRTTKAKS